MKRLPLTVVAALSAVALAGCSSHGSGPAAKPETGPLHVASSAFSDKGLVPINYSCAGASVSPPLSWHGVAPTGTKTWALVVEDTSVAPQPYVHWVVTGIAAATRAVDTGKLPAAARVDLNSSSTKGYVALCPPPGQVHKYLFTVYALGGGTPASKADPLATVSAIAAGALASASLTGTFSR